LDIGKFNYGVIYDNKAICSCGEVNEYSMWKGTVCKKCGNNYFKSPTHSEINECCVNIGGVYDVVSKDDSGFIIKRSQVYAYIDKENLKIKLEQRGNVFKADLSFKRGNILVYKNDTRVTTNEYYLDCVFRGLNQSKLIEDISTEKTKALYTVAYRRYGMVGNERVQKISRALIRLISTPQLQILSACGFSEDILYSVANTIKYSKETKPHLILGYPKYMTDLIRTYNIVPDYGNKDKLLKLQKIFDGTTVKEYFKIFDEESTIRNALRSVDYTITLYEDYNYKDIKKLITYATRDVKLQQGIIDPEDALGYLKDYVKMMMALEHSYEKYPKSLKKVHDIAVMNYNTFESEAKDNAFKNVILQKSYQNLLYNDKTYAIIIPECVKSVILEGESLSHCVASYVDDIIKEKCKIVFLRYKESLDNSLITIEVRNNEIKQVKGKLNRKPTVDEIEFVKMWAEKKELKIHCSDMGIY
jgi:hypothetical protein